MKLGTMELIVILIVVLIIFGPTQIPKLTKMFGKSVKNFKDGLEESDEMPADDSKKGKKGAPSKAENTKDSNGPDA